MPRISVVVPIFNVEPYLEECLGSIAAQSFGDLEVILVDDGSTDGSAAIARDFAARDARFSLITQPNGGLGRARNTGADAATGEFLAFVDSDDALPRNAYALLLGALEESGSDYAAGNVHRLTRHGTSQAPFLRRVFRETQLGTHVTRFPQMLVDRIVPNKLWRRSFWQQHGLRFPEGVLHEDIPVVLPAMFLARSVDLLAEPVYWYRIRQGADRSITQRRAEPKALLDRLAAVQHVSEFLGREHHEEFKRRYDASVVAEDLRYYLNVLELADEEYRALFLDKVNAFLDQIDPRALQSVPAIERLKWHLVRRRLMPELLEVRRFQREELHERTPVREGGRWYGDYPFRKDPRLAIPDAIYRVDGELKPVVRVEDMRWEDGRLHLEGFAFIEGIGAPARGSQKVTVTALRPGRLARIRLLTSGLRFRTRGTHRPDANAIERYQYIDLAWSGFAATLDRRRLRRAGRWRADDWDVYVTVRAGGLKRRRTQFLLNVPRPLWAADLPVDGAGVAVTAAPTEDDGLRIRVRDRWAAIAGRRLDGEVLELSGDLRAAAAGEKLALVAAREGGGARRRYKIAVGDGAFRVRVPLADLVAAAAGAAGEDDDGEDRDAGVTWTLQLAGDGGRRLPVALASAGGEASWPVAGGEVALLRGRDGDACLMVRDHSPVLSAARWSGADVLELEGTAAEGVDELVLLTPGRGEEHAFPLGRDGRNGHFAARLTPARVRTLAGELPLREAAWHVMARAAGAADPSAMVPVFVAESLRRELPLRATAGHKPFRLTMTPDRRAILVAQRDLDPDERGRFNEHRLRAAYAARRTEPLRDAVVYTSFGGRQYSDSPRAICEELVRRGAPLQHLWVVSDARCVIPPAATVLREGSREYHEALARSRYVVTNDHFREWFRRRDDQVCLQTWHGTPLKKIGFDASATQQTTRRFERNWDERVRSWQYVVSPNAFTTPIMRRAYRIEGELLETGYPRNDVLAAPGRAERERRVRERLGLPDGTRTVLYAPTFRDHVIDRNRNYRLDLRIDLERLRGALGPQTVVLVRKHHYIVDPVPTSADGFVRDVSEYPDGTELLLAADVLVTDYSSMMFDFANTGRPMLFFTYDLEDYADRIRGFYLDLEAIAPGPLLRTGDEVVEALRGIDDVRARYAERYAAFARRFCELDDGGAAARVVDRVFAGL